MSEKIYVGSGKEKKFDDGGSVINIHLTLNDISSLFKEYGYTAKNGDKRIKLNISSRREEGQYGETHAVTIDTWKPKSSGSGDPFGGSDSSQGGGGVDDSDIPF